MEVEDLSSGMCFCNKKEDVNLKVFNMTAGINESKTLAKDIALTVDVNLMIENVNKSKNAIMISVGVIVKIQYACIEDYVWNPSI